MLRPLSATFDPFRPLSAGGDAGYRFVLGLTAEKALSK